MVNLYFCNGWHRPGGKHPIPYSERDKVLQVLFPNTPEPANRDATASHLREPRAPSFPETRFSEIYGSTLLTGRSAGQHSRRTPQTPATNRRQEQRAPSVANESEAPLEVANQILQSARPRGQQLEIPAQTPAPRRQSARIRAQAPATENSGLHGQQLEPGAQAPAPGRQSSRTQSQVPVEDRNRIHETSSIQQLRRSARIQGQEAGGSLEASQSTVQATAAPLIIPATQTRRGARIRGPEPDTLPPTYHPSNDREIGASSRAVPEIPRRSARLRGLQLEADRSITSSSQATPTASSPRSASLRRSTRIRGQEQHREGANAPAAQIPAPQSSPSDRPNETDHIQPTHSSISAPISREHRMARDVNAVEQCGICYEQLGDGRNVGRCYHCGNDFHKLCWATWWSTGSQTCGIW